MLSREDYDIKNYPELFPSLLNRLVEEITECSNEDLDTVASLRQKYRDSCKKRIENMWLTDNIPEKIIQLKELEKSYPPDFHAWRPTTGTIPMPTIIGHTMQWKREVLENKLKQKREQSAALRKQIAEKREIISGFIKELDEADYDETLKRLCHP